VQGPSRSLLLLLAVTLFAASATAQEVPFPSRQPRPNIVFVLVDDLGIGQVGAYRANKIETPNLDKLAAQGVRFTDVYAGSSVCSPSRLALYTGRDARIQRANDNSALLNRDDLTLPQVLRRAGYETYLVGKWGLGVHVGENDPMTLGFDHWFGELDNVVAHRQYPTRLYQDNRRVPIPENRAGARATLAHDLYTAQALAFIQKPHPKPFFLMLAYTFPHAELASPADTYQQYESAFEEVPYGGRRSPVASDRRYYPLPVDRPRAVHAGMVAAIDRDVGRLVAALREAGLEDDTLFIFSSDNGPHRAGGADPDFFEASAPHRGLKRDLYEGGIRVPMIVRWPGEIEPGRVDETPWAFWDFLPTLSSIAGVNLASVDGARTNGVSLLPLWRGDGTLPQRDLYWELKLHIGDGTPSDFRQALRRGRWKVVRYGADAPVQLYDLKTDPGEVNDRSADRPDIAQPMREFLDAEVERRSRPGAARAR
jgi:arylsulfatase A-like enzyme